MGNEFNELMDSMCSFAKVAKKELDKITQKGDLSPAELDNVKKISEVMKNISCVQNGEQEASYGYGYGYGGGMSGRRYMDSYGGNYGNYGNDMGYSETRGRSPVTGRYISRGMDGGYSGHSIEDRMIASLEQQMDAAKTDYERKMIEEEIKHIRMGNR